MSNGPGISRRRFMKLCATSAALVSANPQALARSRGPVHRYNRVKLVDPDRNPIRLQDLEAGKNYVFHYPYATTPCFLLNLGDVAVRPTVLETKAGQRYEWTGGVGPRRSVVAFSAICSHRMSYPAHQVSFINYRPETVAFVDEQDHVEHQSHVIFCCSERSVYDALRGAKVLGGPAPQPLAAISLQHAAEDDSLYALGTQGGELFERFFDKFGFHLSLEYQTDDIREQVTGTTLVVPLEDYTHNQILC
jgi:arsenite oxidase small subunit